MSFRRLAFARVWVTLSIMPKSVGNRSLMIVSTIGFVDLFAASNGQASDDLAAIRG